MDVDALSPQNVSVINVNFVMQKIQHHAKVFVRMDFTEPSVTKPVKRILFSQIYLLQHYQQMPLYVETYVITAVRATIVLVMAYAGQQEIVSVKKITLTAQTVDVLKPVP
tara:strand:- start:1423 stop:1752 length:330 start_codon:yes stop_codon:yes gene_type:complete